MYMYVIFPSYNIFAQYGLPSLANIHVDDESAQQESSQSQPCPPKPTETSEEDEDSPVPKRPKLTSPAACKEPSEQNEHTVKESSSKRLSERLKSLTDMPSEIPFEAEIPIVEKSTTSTSTTAQNLQSSDEKLLSAAQEMESSSSDVYADEKVDSLEIFFETTVHNSNVLHVCCQLNDGSGGVGAKAGKAAGEERDRERERGGEGGGRLVTCMCYKWE